MTGINAKTEYWTDSKYDKVARHLVERNLTITLENVRVAAFMVFGEHVNMSSITISRVRRVVMFVEKLHAAEAAAKAARMDEALSSRGPMSDLILKGMMTEVVKDGLSGVEANLVATISSMLSRHSAMVQGMLTEHRNLLCKEFGITPPELPAPTVCDIIEVVKPAEPAVKRRKMLIFGVQASQKRYCEDMLKTDEGVAASKNVRVEFAYSSEAASRVRGSFHTILYLEHFIEKTGVDSLSKRGQRVVGVRGTGTMLALEMMNQLLELQVEMEKEREIDRIARD